MFRPNKKTVLIVEDNLINREMLKSILEEEYNIIEAENGKEGIDVLRQNASLISLVLLDIVMPVMDGFQFLEQVSKDQMLNTIPIIMTTTSDSPDSEIRCLNMGASEYVRKPYNPKVVLKRTEALIRLREASTMVQLLAYDNLTGLYNEEYFYQKVSERMNQNPDKKFDLICTDIKDFRMINTRYGFNKGNEILKYFAEILKSTIDEDVIVSRLNRDKFAIFTPHFDTEYQIARCDELHGLMAQFDDLEIDMKFGINPNIDKDDKPSYSCDFTLMMLRDITNRYGHHVIIFDQERKDKMTREHALLDSLDQALAEKQFQVFYQPKCNAQTGEPEGAEALIRWFHPEFGFVSPGDFIPLFEKNGAIFKVDEYVVRRVCEDIIDWKERGVKLLPISTNLSRIDFDIPNLEESFEQTVDSYGVDHDLIHIEITESAYTEDQDIIIDTAKKFRNRNFKVELDDFGAGCSSLGMLSSLDVDVLKLDMSLIRQMDLHDDAKDIVHFAMNMANWLGVKTVAEGVETKEQVERLRKAGCTYIQGYYFARPMPKNEYEEFIL